MNTEVQFCGVCQKPTTFNVETTAHYTIHKCTECGSRYTKNHPPSFSPKTDTNWQQSNMLNPETWGKGEQYDKNTQNHIGDYYSDIYRFGDIIVNILSPIIDKRS